MNATQPVKWICGWNVVIAVVVVAAAGVWRIGVAEAAADKQIIDYAPPKNADGFTATFSPGPNTKSYFAITARDASSLTASVNGQPAYHTDTTAGQFVIVIPNQKTPTITIAMTAKAGSVLSLTRVTYDTAVGAVVTGSASLDSKILSIMRGSGINAVVEIRRKPKKPTISSPAYADSLLEIPGTRAVRYHHEGSNGFFDNVADFVFGGAGLLGSIFTGSPLPLLVALVEDKVVKDVVDNQIPNDASPDVDEIFMGRNPEDALKIGGIRRAMRDVYEHRRDGQDAVALYQRTGVTTGWSNMGPRWAGETSLAPWWNPKGKTHKPQTAVLAVLDKLALNPVGVDFAGGTATYLPAVTLMGNSADADMNNLIRAIRDRSESTFSVSGSVPAAFQAELTRAFGISGSESITIPTLTIGDTGQASSLVEWFDQHGKVVQTDSCGSEDCVSTFAASSATKSHLVLPFITLEYGDSTSGVLGPTIKAIGAPTYLNALAYPVKGSALASTGTTLVEGFGIPGVNTAEYGTTRKSMPHERNMFRVASKKCTTAEITVAANEPDNDDTAASGTDGDDDDGSASAQAESPTPNDDPCQNGKELALIGLKLVAHRPIWYAYQLPNALPSYDVSVRLQKMKKVGKEGYAGLVLTEDLADLRKRVEWVVARDADSKNPKDRSLELRLEYPSFSKQPDVIETLCKKSLTGSGNWFGTTSAPSSVTLTLKQRPATNGARFIGVANGATVCDVTYTKTEMPLAFQEAGVVQQDARTQYDGFEVIKRNPGDP